MQELQLEHPRLHHLQKNTVQALHDLDQAISELVKARAAWSLESDNREKLAVLADRLAKTASNLAEVGDEDRELCTAERRRSELCAGLSTTLRQVRFQVDSIYSEEEGVKPLRKRLNRALDDAKMHLRAYGGGSDTRPQFIAALERAKGYIAESGA